MLTLAHGLSFSELYTRDGVEKIDAAFVAHLKAANVDLHNRYITARTHVLNNSPEALAHKEESNLLLDVAPHLEDFIGSLFGVADAVRNLAKQHHNLANIYLCKRLFVQRRAPKICSEADAQNVDAASLKAQLEDVFGEPLTELSFSNHVMAWLDDKGVDKPGYEEKVKLAGQYASWALHADAGKKAHRAGVLFKKPSKLDFQNLFPVETEIQNGITVLKLDDHHLRYREGFSLTDAGASLEKALDDANYCIYCHNQGKDSCSKGMKESTEDAGKIIYKKTPLDIPQAGCPLEEHISEMNTLKAQGFSIAALGMVTINNPLCPATGHRICNDCMKGCIYQKQEPVNIPQVETRTLQDVLDLPWGFEIYSLLTRWNPLNLRRPLMKKETGYKILVAGLGPAGFQLSHELLNDGHTVVGVDGLKIEPLPEHISGVDAHGGRVPFTPIYDTRTELFEDLNDRVLAGFGGVAEYGITVRWNKNYLKIIRLVLERRAQMAIIGGVRFGSTLTPENVWKLGFDHVALCMGAGKPTLIPMPNAMARGVRTASDFLMSLQLTGSAKEHSIANLQLRLPVLVIGGGLTAVDTVTESLAYYPVQVEKFLHRYETLVKERGEAPVRASWNAEEAEIADELIQHAHAIRAEKELAKKENRSPNIFSLLKSWGGAKIVYRKTLQDAPSYRLNHEEVELAMQEGLEFLENMSPIAVEVDDYGHASGLKVKTPEGEKTLPARSIFIAAGTSPNTVLNRESSLGLHYAGKFFAAVDDAGNSVHPQANTSKPYVPQVLLHKDASGKFISYFGDMHPSFVGNVVKAMGSAKQGYPTISRVLQKLSVKTDKAFLTNINHQLRARVHEVIRLTPNIVEVVIEAPLAAAEFQPGQFYRVQNFESLATCMPDGTRLAMEGLALTGAWVDKAKGLMSTIVLEMGGSSDLCAHLKPGEPVICMGPTGTPTHIPSNTTVMLVGGGLGNAVLFSIGKACRVAGSKVLYFAGYKKKQDRYKVSEIEAAADVIVWCCDEGSFSPERPQDFIFHGNIVQAIAAYAKGELGATPIDTKAVTHLITIGSDRMMAAVAHARHTALKDYLNPTHEAIGSINSPMQCMMKEICAQCLQRHIDPITGEERYVYSCFNQDQKLDCVDWQHLNDRLRQNSVQEKLTTLWIDLSLQQLGLRNKR